MSLCLSNSSPIVEVKTTGFLRDSRGKEVVLFRVDRAKADIPMDDFLEAVRYVVTNTDLLKDDPRTKFIEDLKKLEVVPGYGAGAKRLGLPVKTSAVRVAKRKKN